jgi:hypothetical protein
VKRKVTKAQEPIREKVVDLRVTLHIDLMFLSGVSFLVGSCATGSRERESSR